MNKTRISQLIVGDIVCYTVQKKFHWWEKWHYVMTLDGKYPRLFTKQELVKFGLVKEDSHE